MVILTCLWSPATFQLQLWPFLKRYCSCVTLIVTGSSSRNLLSFPPFILSDFRSLLRTLWLRWGKWRGTFLCRLRIDRLGILFSGKAVALTIKPGGQLFCPGAGVGQPYPIIQLSLFTLVSIGQWQITPSKSPATFEASTRFLFYS